MAFLQRFETSILAPFFSRKSGVKVLLRFLYMVGELLGGLSCPKDLVWMSGV